MVKKGLVVHDKVGPDTNQVWFETLDGGLGIDAQGGMSYSGSFYHKNKDLIGMASLLEPRVYPVVVPSDNGTHRLNLVLEEVVYASVPQDTPYQFVRQLAGAESNISTVQQAANEAKKAESIVTAKLAEPFMAQMPGPDPVINAIKQASPYLGSLMNNHHGGSTSVWVKIQHILTGIDPYTFSHFQASGWYPFPPPGANGGFENTMFMPAGPLLYKGEEHRWYPAQPKIGSSVTETNGLMEKISEMTVGYQRNVLVSGGGIGVSPIHRLLMNAAPQELLVEPVLNDHAAALIQKVYEMPGPDFMRWDTDAAREAAEAGLAIPTLAGGTVYGPEEFYFGLYPPHQKDLTVTASNIGHYLSMDTPNRMLTESRLMEGRELLHTVTDLAAELFTADFEVRIASTGETVGWAKAPDTAMRPEYPISVFLPTGEKVRQVQVEEFNEDSLLF